MTSNKLISLEDAVAQIPSGATITAGGFAHSHQPMALTRALLSAGVRNLTLIGVAECWVAEFLAAGSAMRRAYMSNFMLEGYGRCYRFSKGVEANLIEVEDHSHFGILSRLFAGGTGLPFISVRSMAGTDILEKTGFEPRESKWQKVRCPFGGEDVTVVSPLRADFALIHGARSDSLGNVQLFGPTSAVEEQVRAARTVIASVEEIVDTSRIRTQPELTVIPGFMVDAVVHIPFGAHPTGVYGYYEHDSAHLDNYYTASRDENALHNYLDRFVYGPGDHWEYLDQIGIETLSKLTVDPALGYIL